LETAAKKIAEKKKSKPERVFLNMQYDDFYAPTINGSEDSWRLRTPELMEGFPDGWFANLNTPEEFAEAEMHLDALDT
jgi:molybdenum cofactor guanylyltransferase